MEKLSSLNFTFDKVLLQIVIPGLIAIFPWFLLFIHSHPNAKNYLIANPSIIITTLIFLSLIAGTILENLGGRFEVLYLDYKNSKKDSEYEEIWKKFLLLKYTGEEPIGHRYIRNILHRMKFELSAGVALIPMQIGLIILNNQRPIFENHVQTCILIIFFPLAICLYLLFVEAPSSSKVLADTRKVLVNKFYT